MAELHEQASIVSETYVQDGTLIAAYCPPSLASRLRALGLTAAAPTAAAFDGDADSELLEV